MEIQSELVAGKVKQVFTKRGTPYTRKGYDVKVNTYEKFARKCRMLGEPETRVVEKLVEAFCMSTGWGREVKTPPFLMPQASEHIKEASQSVQGEYPWIT